MDYGGGYADNRQQTTEEAVPVNGQQTTVNRRPSGVMLLTVTTEEAMPENGKATPVNGQRSTVNGLAIRSDAVDDDNGRRTTAIGV